MVQDFVLLLTIINLYQYHVLHYLNPLTQFKFDHSPTHLESNPLALPPRAN